MREFLIRLLDTLNGLSHRSSSPMASLERSMTAAHHAHTSARRALAVAMAEETREAERRLALVAKTSDLEQRAIAAMTADIDASERASHRFVAEVALARREVDAQRRRLSELDRGRRLARIGDALTATMHASETGLDSFSEAEVALAKVVANNHDARVIRQEMAPPAEQLIERLSDAGFGEPVRVLASDVLVRLRAAAGNKISQLIESHRHP
jgi:hypothetical protein